MRQTLIAILLCAAATPSGAQTLAQHPRVAQALEVMRLWLDAQQAYERIPGITAAVVYQEQLLWSGGFGYADLARKAPATPSTIFSICSIAKLFTGIAALQLRDAGKLRLDDPVRQHLPWFTVKDTSRGAPDVTVEALLTHSAGLGSFHWTGPDFLFPTVEEIRQRSATAVPLYASETAYQYSNFGMAVMGEVIASASGRSYNEYVTRNIFEPLGLRSTTPDMPEEHRGGRLATGYSAIPREGSRRPLPFFRVRGLAAAAGAASTAEDLARFAAWQFRLLSSGGTEVLKASSLRTMQRPQWVDPDMERMSGLGFEMWRANGKSFVGHSGYCPGYRTMLLLNPSEKIATVFMANALGVGPEQHAQNMYDVVAPAITAAAADTARGRRPFDPSLARYIGAYEYTNGGELAVVAWEDGLALLPLPTANPARSLMLLRKTGEHRFQRIRNSLPGDPLVFELGPDQRASRFTWSGDYYRRIR